MRGQPVYTVFETLTLELQAAVQVDGVWKSLDDAGLIKEVSWSTERIDLTSLTDVTRLKLSFKATATLDEVKSAYGDAQFPAEFEFVVRNWNLSSRTRRIHSNGVIQVMAKQGKSPARVSCVLDPLELDLSEFSGEIELQPLIIAKKEMIDFSRRGGGPTIKLQKAGIVGWTDPLTVILDRTRSGIDSLFEFRWESFSSGAVPGVGTDEFFAIRWESRPILYLNKDVDGLEQVLTCADKTGKRARARDMINSVVAHQALTVAISTSIYAAREIKIKLPEIDLEDIEKELSPLERTVLKAWIHAADPLASGRSTPLNESLGRLVMMDESEVQRAISEHLPQSLQSALGSLKATDEMLKTFMERGDS
jgi:hypothetical protein